MGICSGISIKWLFIECFQIELHVEFRRVDFWREENRRPERKTLRARARTNNKLNPHMMPSPGIEPGPHWWQASAL